MLALYQWGGEENGYVTGGWGGQMLREAEVLVVWGKG